MTADYSWFLACHKRGKNNLFRAQMALWQMGVTSFSPLIYINKARKDREGKLRSTVESLFPGYFFINFSPEKQKIKDVESTPGFSHLVRVGIDIKPLREEVVLQIMSLPFCSMGNKPEKSEPVKRLDGELIEIVSIDNKEERLLRFCEYVSTSQEWGKHGSQL